MNRLPASTCTIPIQRITIAATAYRVETDGVSVIATALDASTVKAIDDEMTVALAGFLEEDGGKTSAGTVSQLRAFAGHADHGRDAERRLGTIGGIVFDTNRIAVVLDAVNAGDGAVSLTLRPEGEGHLLQLRGQDWIAAVMSVKVPALEVQAA